MSIVNRRNALLGWGVWQIGKTAARRKAKQALEPEDDSRLGKPGKRAAIVSGLAATGGTIYFWRRRRGDDEET